MKTMNVRKKAFALFLALCMAVGLASCGGNTAEESSPYAGKYISVAGEMVGITLTGEDIAGFAIELKDGGKGTMEVDGSSGNMKWSENNGVITIEIEGETLEGTLGEDTIVFDDFMNLGLTLTMAKEGTDAASADYS